MFEYCRFTIGIKFELYRKNYLRIIFYPSYILISLQLIKIIVYKSVKIIVYKCVAQESM